MIVVRGEAGLADLARAEEVLQGKPETEYIRLVGWRPAAPAVERRLAERKGPKSKVKCQTFDQLVEEFLEVPAYIGWLEKEIERRRVNEFYIPLACTRDEYDPTTNLKLGISRYDRSNGGLDGYIDRWLDDPSKEHVSILGEFGTGKSWFALHYAWRMIQDYRKAMREGRQRPRLPLVIPLRDFARAGNIESLLNGFGDGTRGIQLNFDTFEQLNRMGRFLLIFDGFDEMAMVRRPDAVIGHFWELAKVATAGSKVILTCRAEHFLNNEEGRGFLRGELRKAPCGVNLQPSRFEILQLEMLEEDQVQVLIERRYGKETARKVRSNRALREYAKRPVLADFIVEALPDLAPGRVPELAQIYLHAACRKIERDVGANSFRSMKEKFRFFCELSWQMLSKGTMSLRFSEFSSSVRQFLKAGRGVGKGDPLEADLRGDSLFTRNGRGDYTPTHRSLIEFFAAYRFVGELGVMGGGYRALLPGSAKAPRHGSPGGRDGNTLSGTRKACFPSWQSSRDSEGNSWRGASWKGAWGELPGRASRGCWGNSGTTTPRC